ncbi:transporter substrate-binding domain-containing protein [Pseudomonas sp. CAU 1711]|uniref:substrate-binding periplasmic protein n=1 Tax=Pseudomonas sp. CAU 1711 TaxID=3140356 RepID=UPI0032605DA3
MLRVLLLAVLSSIIPPLSAEQVVRVGTGDWRPYVDQGRADAGALARLVDAVFAEAGYRVEFSFYPWDRNVLMLQQGALDAIMPYSCTPARQDYAACSEPLVSGEIVLFHRKDRTFDWESLQDLRGLRIATTLGYSYGPQFDRAVQDGALQIEQSSKEETAFRLLELGRVDLHPQDRAVGYALLHSLFSPEQRLAITHHPRYLNTEPLRLLFRKDDPHARALLQQFNARLAEFARRGELRRLQQALFSGNADRWRPGR